MDYRNRKYYLVTIEYFAYDMRLRYFKLAAPTLKIHSPYNHVKNHQGYDGRKIGRNGSSRDYWQMMISCKIEDSESLEYELRKAQRNDKSKWFEFGSYYMEINKNILGQ